MEALADGVLVWVFFGDSTFALLMWFIFAEFKLASLMLAMEDLS